MISNNYNNIFVAFIAAIMVVSVVMPAYAQSRVEVAAPAVDPLVTPNANSNEIHAALFAGNAATICSVVGLPVDPISTATVQLPSQGFPFNDASYLIISSGNAAVAVPGPSGGSASTSNSNPDGLPYPVGLADPLGNIANDVATVTISCNLPSGATSISYDWMYGTEEGSVSFADYFRTTGTYGNTAILPNALSATNDHARPISATPVPDDTVLSFVACTGGTACSLPITTVIDVSAEAGSTITITFEVADDGDTIVDTAAFIDNFNVNGFVGGKSLDIDSTALIIAGASANAVWLLPVLAGLAGAGIYLTRSKLNWI